MVLDGIIRRTTLLENMLLANLLPESMAPQSAVQESTGRVVPMQVIRTGESLVSHANSPSFMRTMP